MSKSGIADREFIIFLQQFDLAKLERMRDSILGEQRAAVDAEIRRRSSPIPIQSEISE